MPERLSSEGTRGGDNRPEHGEEERREWETIAGRSESGGDGRDGEPLRVVTTGGGGVTGTVIVALFSGTFFISLNYSTIGTKYGSIVKVFRKVQRSVP